MLTFCVRQSVWALAISLLASCGISRRLRCIRFVRPRVCSPYIRLSTLALVRLIPMYPTSTLLMSRRMSHCVATARRFWYWVQVLSVSVRVWSSTIRLFTLSGLSRRLVMRLSLSTTTPRPYLLTTLSATNSISSL